MVILEFTYLSGSDISGSWKELLGMGAIFISYRREDSAGWTGRLAERLKQKFGTESIFMDIDAIQAGTDFTQALRSAVGACDVLLAMIGPEWGIAKNSDGLVRLKDPNDWVRTELTTALGRGIPVIPVLVGGASLPKLSTLPDDLKKLFNYQAHELTDKRWDYDSSQLVQVLEKVIHGAKPKRNIAQTILTNRSTWVALIILGLLLGLTSIQFLKGRTTTEDEASEKREFEVLQSKVFAPKLVESAVPAAATAQTPTESTAENTGSMVAQEEVSNPVASPMANTDTSKAAKVAPTVSPTGQKGRSLPAGIDVKLGGGDFMYRLASIRLEDQSNDNWLLKAVVIVRNKSDSNFLVHYADSFRLLISDAHHAPTKASPAVLLDRDSEQSGELSFTVPKMVRQVGFRISHHDEQTTIPMDLRAGVSRSDVQPPGIPKSLPKIARMDNLYKGLVNYDFRAITLEPYSVEFFILRFSVRATTNDSSFWDFNKGSFRLFFDDMSHAPAKGPNPKELSPQTGADADILFVVPKSITQATIKVKDADNWRNVPIDLKVGKS